MFELPFQAERFKSTRVGNMDLCLMLCLEEAAGDFVNVQVASAKEHVITWVSPEHQAEKRFIAFTQTRVLNSDHFEILAMT